MCQGGKPDTGKFHSSYIGMNVCGSAYENGAWSMACVLQRRIEYYCTYPLANPPVVYTAGICVYW